MVSLRVRLGLWTVAIEVLLLLVLSVVLVMTIGRREYRSTADLLRLSADELNAVVDVYRGAYIVPSEDAGNVAARGVMAWITDADETVVTTTPDAAADAMPDVPAADVVQQVALADGTRVYALRTALHEGDSVLGYLTVAVPVAESRQFVRHIWVALAIAIPLVLVLSLGGGWFLAGRALSPIARIADTALRISSVEDLSQRLQLDTSDDEIGVLAATFNGMLDRLEVAFQHDRRFTADASHELRMPLGLLKVQMSLARSKERSAAELKTMILDMEGDVDRMTRLVEQMLSLARMDQNAPLALHEVRLVDVIRPAVDDLRQSGQLPVPVVHSVGGGDAKILGEAEPLERAFRNLLENAVKCTPSDGNVEVEIATDGRHVTVVVRDSGTGIPAEALPHLFERFYRVDDSRSRQSGGFGLGLAIVKSVVEAHQGTVRTQSEVGAGTVFTVRFPIARSP